MQERERSLQVTPWGSSEVIFEGDGFLVKILTIKPHQRTSLQYHQHRNEQWTVLDGRDSIGEMTTVPMFGVHRIENKKDTDLVILEIWYGRDLREDDIIRIEDDYGRV